MNYNPFAHIHRIPTVFVLIFFVMSVLLSVWLLRQNNLRMVNLREKVFQVDDETGDINKIQPHLTALGDYVLNHMNTNLKAPIELPGAYNRAVEQARERAEASGQANSSVYAQAQSICEDPNVLLTVRAQCIQDYVTQNAAPGSDPTELEFPDKALFSYSFATPFWSPDLAGLSVLLATLSAITLVVFGFTRLLIPLLSRTIDNDPLE